MEDKRIKVSQEEIDAMKAKFISKKINENLSNREKDKMLASLNNKIERALAGWPTAPSDFTARCLLLFGVNKDWVPIATGHPSTEFLPTGSDIIDTSYDKEMLAGLSLRERKIFKQRVESYKKEFDLNDSSDYAMILQVVADEVIQRRYIRDILQEEKVTKGADISKLMDALNKRLSGNLEVLGITRSKRKELQEEKDGNVAQIADALEEKLRNIAKINREHMAEEEMYMKMKMGRSGPVNVIPSMQELKETAEEFGYDVDASKIKEVDE